MTEAAADYWNGGHFAAFDPFGTNYGHGAQVADYVQGTLTLDTAAMNTWDATSNYRLVRGDSLAASDKLTGSAVKYAVALGNALQMYTWKGGFYNVILCPETQSDLMDDSVFQALAEYHGDDKSIYNGYIKSLWGAKFYR